MKQLTFQERTKLFSAYLFRYPYVKHFPFQSKEHINRFQFGRIKQLLHIAYNHCPYYNAKYSAVGLHPEDITTWEHFYQIPPLTKDEVIEHGRDIVDSRIDLESLFLSRSSGSSGRFVNVWLDSNNFIEQELHVIRMLSDFYPPYGPLDHEILVYTSEMPFTSVAGMYKTHFIHNMLPAAEIMQLIEEIDAVIVAIYPSILRELVNRFPDRVQKRGWKAIVTNSEQSSQRERDYFETVTGCPVFDEFSSEEVPGIAHQCQTKNYHVTQDSCVIEIMQPGTNQHVPNNTLGEIIGTNLVNFAMPFIRYRQGDFASLTDTTCTCGSNFPVISNLLGRLNASFTSPESESIPSGRVLDWTYDLLLKHNLDIKEFQVTQHTINRVEVAIVPGQNYTSTDNDVLIQKSFVETFGAAFQVDVSMQKAIEKGSTGKHIPIRSFVG